MTRGRRPIRLWGVGTSRTRRPHWVLNELNLEYEVEEILPRSTAMESAEFQAISPRRKVPMLEHGDLVVGESGAIVFHLVDHYRDRVSLAPGSGSDERAIFDDVCLFALMELDAPLYVIRRHGGLPAIYGESPVAVDSAREYFLRQSGEIARRLSDGRTYVLGEDFSAADILVSTCLTWADFIGIEVADSLVDYQSRVTSRPAFALAKKRNLPAAAMAAMRDQASSGVSSPRGGGSQGRET